MWARLRSWLKAVFTRSEMEDRLAAELRFHIESYAADLKRSGVPPEEALRRARIEFGPVETQKDDCRRSLGLRLWDELRGDLRYGFRAMRRNPGFTSVAVLTLALGMGANTAIFSLINAVMLQTLPVRQPQQLVRFMKVDKAAPQTEEGYYSYPAFREFRDETHLFSGILAFNGPGRANLAVDGRGELATFQDVSGNYFDVLGIQPYIGRLIAPQDDEVPGASPVAVISYSYWQKRFNGDRNVLGKTVTVNDHSPLTIIGVTPPEFFGLDPGYSVDISFPIAMRAQVSPGHAMAGTANAIWSAPNRRWLRIVARLQPEVKEKAAVNDLDSVLRGVKEKQLADLVGRGQDSPRLRERVAAERITLAPGSTGMAELREQFSKPLLVLMATVGVLLLIACANVAQLLLARANARKREMAVRTALGAGKFRLVRQLLTEGLFLAVAGGALGVPLAFLGNKLLLARMGTRSGFNLQLLHIQPDFKILLFTMTISLVTVLLFALAPALHSIRVNLAPALKEGMNAIAGSERTILGKGLVISQVALCMMLLMGAGLLVRSLAKLQGIDPGFERQNVVLLSVVPEMAGYKGPQVSHLESELLEKMRSLPGVQTASVSLFTPMGVCCIGSEAHIQGYTPRPGEDLTVNVNYLGPDHFRTLGTPVLLGREFNDGDTATSQKVAVINESMARRFFVDASPLGRTLSVDDETPLQIIGVVGDLKNRSLREKTMPSAYRPLLQSEAGGAVVFEIRTAAEPAGTISAMKRLVRSVDSRIPVGLGGTLAQQVSDSLAQERMVASLATVFGLLALLLANVGLYGLMAYAVTRRTGEIGIRMALGAGRGDVLWMVLRETLLLVTLGLAAGLPLALAATRLIKSQLFGLTVTDPTTILVTIMAMLAVAVLASYLPARKATRVNPITALRYE